MVTISPNPDAVTESNDKMSAHPGGRNENGGDNTNYGVPVSDKNKTPKQQIAELARFHKLKHEYQLMDESGPAHKKLFTVQLVLAPHQIFSGSGASIKKAQQSAAAEALRTTTFSRPPEKNVLKSKRDKERQEKESVREKALLTSEMKAVAASYIEEAEEGTKIADKILSIMGKISHGGGRGTMPPILVKASGPMGSGVPMMPPVHWGGRAEGGGRQFGADANGGGTNGSPREGPPPRGRGGWSASASGKPRMSRRDQNAEKCGGFGEQRSYGDRDGGQGEHRGGGRWKGGPPPVTIAQAQQPDSGAFPMMPFGMQGMQGGGGGGGGWRGDMRGNGGYSGGRGQGGVPNMQMQMRGAAAAAARGAPHPKMMRVTMGSAFPKMPPAGAMGGGFAAARGGGFSSPRGGFSTSPRGGRGGARGGYRGRPYKRDRESPSVGAGGSGHEGAVHGEMKDDERTPVDSPTEEVAAPEEQQQE